MKRTNTKPRCLAQIRIEKEIYSVRAIGHSLDRMLERGIDRWVVSGNILALGKERLLRSKKENKDIALIDEKRKGITIIISFVRNTIKILTVINKTDIYVLNGTTIERLKNE